MRRLLASLFGTFLSWWGLVLFSALDSTVLVVLPFGNDALLIYLVARERTLFWLFPLLATAGSAAGAAITYWIGRTIGKAGLPRLISHRQLARIEGKAERAGAMAVAIPALLPPPFPLAPFVLACGALRVSPPLFFGAFTMARLVRFGIEGALARVYGEGVIRVLESDGFKYAIAAFAALALTGTIVSAALFWRRSRATLQRPAAPMRLG